MSSFFSKGFKQYARGPSSAGFSKAGANFFGTQSKAFMSQASHNQATFNRL